jgi:hypothetical protein
MAISFSHHIPGFVDSHNMGPDGVIDRYAGTYQEKPAVMLVLQDEAARILDVSRRFQELAAAYARVRSAKKNRSTSAQQLKLPARSCPYSCVEAIFLGGKKRRESLRVVDQRRTLP